MLAVNERLCHLQNNTDLTVHLLCCCFLPQTYGFIQQNPPNLFELYIYLKYLSKILYEVDRNDSMAQIEIYPDGSEKDATPSRTYHPCWCELSGQEKVQWGLLFTAGRVARGEELSAEFVCVCCVVLQGTAAAPRDHVSPQWHCWMSVSLSIQLSGECGNVSEMNLPLFFAAYCSGVASPDLQRFYCLRVDMTSHTSRQKQLSESFQSC